MPFRAYSARVFRSRTTFPSFMEAWMKCRLLSFPRQAMPVWVMSSPGVVLRKQMMSPSSILSYISGIFSEGMEKYAAAVSSRSSLLRMSFRAPSSSRSRG